MGRFISTGMSSILAASERTIDYTLQVTFPDASFFRFATKPLTIGLDTYTNDLESVSEIRQTLEAPADRLRVGVQNKDRVLGLDIAANWQKWRRAEAVIGRQYDNLKGSVEWKEMFRGAVQQPNADDLQVTFDVLHDTQSAGLIICNRTLGDLCPWLYKDAKTCGSTSLLTTCNHHLRSTGGCDGRANAHRYGGMEHRYVPTPNVPGTGGNPGGGGHGGCPRLDQYVIVRGEGDIPIAKMVCFFTEEDDLWNPIGRTFHKTRHAKVLHGQKIWEVVAANGAVGFSSFTHPLIAHVEDCKGTAVKKVRTDNDVLTAVNYDLDQTRVIYSADTGETGEVMFIEMADGKIYAYGDSQDKMIVCHNSKYPDDI